MTLVSLSGCFVSDLFYKVGICVNISLNHSNNLWEVVSDHFLLLIHVKYSAKVKLGKLKSVQNIEQFLMY